MSDRRPLLATARTELMTDAEVARLLRRGVKWLAEHRAELEVQGFPKRIPVVGRYDPMAVHAWLDRLGGVGRHKASSLDEKFDKWERFA